MKFSRPVLALTAALALAAWLAAPQLSARQVAPGAPADLGYVLNGRNLTVRWTHSTGPFTSYLINVGTAPGVIDLARFPTTSFVDPSKLPQYLSAVTNPVAPTGTYYVSVQGVNAGVLGPASPEISVVIPGGCVAPGAPTNLTAIVRGSASWIAWNPGTGGAPSTYVLQASTGSGANFAAGFLGQAAFAAPSFNVGLPPGTYYLRAAATNACGSSGFSNEIVVAAGVNTPAVTPAPATGRLPQFDVRADVVRLAQQARNAGLMDASVSCPTRSGFSDGDIEARKVNLNGYINYMVDNLRLIDGRFGYNAKDPRSAAFGSPLMAIVAGDEFTYHYGRDAAQGSPNVYIVDILGGHCTGANGGTPRESVDYRPFYNEYGTWTGAGRF